MDHEKLDRQIHVILGIIIILVVVGIAVSIIAPRILCLFLTSLMGVG